MRIGKFVAEWNYPLGKSECPYAFRWRLDFYWFSFRLHKWLRSDDKRAFHNHPWHFITFILKGGYKDVVRAPEWSHGTVSYEPLGTLLDGSFKKLAWRNKDHQHYVSIEPLTSPVWTFIITFGAPRKYAFWDVLTGKRRNRDKYFIEMGHPPCDEL